MQVGTVEIYIDAKGWLPSATASRLRASMKGVDGDSKQPGQLLKDLVKMYNEKGNAKFKIEWHFDKRSLEPNDWSDTYLATIKNELEKGDGGEKIRELLGKVDDDEWEAALLEINKKLDNGFIKVLSD